MTLLLGVDTGGTFTDFVVLEDGRLRVHKVLSSPAQPERAIIQGVRELGLDTARLSIVHGSTVATNAVLEGKGARTALVTNHGLGDLLTIGRQARRDLYDLQPPAPPPPVPHELCLEVGGRLAAGGGVVEPLTEGQLADLRAALERLQPQAVAINLLFAFLDDRFERRVAGAVPPGLFVSRSSEVLPEYREYERGMATWLNSYVGPLLQGYLERLQSGLAPAPVTVMQSSGGTIAASQAAAHGVNMLLSGPAGGLMGARFVARAAGRDRLMTFDMGGTSTDVALIDGGVRLTSEGRVAGYPVAVPSVDMHTIGAGGGSVASVDEGGLLQVGPESAGADPGPACYGRGGQRPTVTDANLILGRLRPDAFLGGAMALDLEAARGAFAPLAAALGVDMESAAQGVVRLANEHMARALRVISVQRGEDPRQFTLVSFGGAGGLHVCALAETLGMTQALVPVHAGVLSALGMLVAPRARQLSRTIGEPLAEVSEAVLEARLAEMAAQGTAALAAEGVPRAAVQTTASLDLRYQGQSYVLNIAWKNTKSAANDFHRAHQARFGHALDAPVELVNLRLGLRGPTPEVALAPLAKPAAGADKPKEKVELCGFSRPVPVYSREGLPPGAVVGGPALIVEQVATTWVAPQWRCRVDDYGNLLLAYGGAP